MKRPFPVVFHRASRSGLLELQLSFQNSLTPPQRAGWQDVVKTFVEAAQCGAMSGSGIAPVSSGCVVEKAVLVEHEGFWLLRETALDANAVTILINLCHWGHANVSALGRLMVSWDRCPNASDAERIAFPLAWPRPSFELHEYELVGQTIAVDIEFAQSQSALTRDQMNEMIGHWFKSANWGGYADDQFPPATSTIVIAPETVTSDAWGISWYFDSYHCSHRAFDGLVNCLERVSAIQAPIERVLIGQ